MSSVVLLAALVLANFTGGADGFDGPPRFAANGGLMSEGDGGQGRGRGARAGRVRRGGRARGAVSGGRAQPAGPSEGLAGYPDRPLPRGAAGPVSPAFLVEHRTALDGKTVRVRGVVVGFVGGDSEAGGAQPQPRLTLADTADPGRDRNYDVPVLLGEGARAGEFKEGATVVVSGVVSASRYAVAVRRTH